MLRSHLSRRLFSLFILLVIFSSKPTALQAASPTSAAAIDAYLQKYHSPMVGSGAAYMRWGEYFNVDPRLIVGISNAESTLGIGATGYNAWGWFLNGSIWNGFAAGIDADTKTYSDAPNFVSGQGISMGSGWEDGIFWVTHTLSKEYINAGQNTVDGIQSGSHRYCASGCTDWIPNVKATISELGGDPNQLSFPKNSGSSGRPILVPASQWLGGQGVDAYDNGSDVNNDWGNSYVGSTYVGLEYQCVELPQRLYTVRGWYNGSFVANAVDIYDAAGRLGMVAHSNGSGYVPVPGDMVVLSGDTYGHVAVVDTVDNNNVNVVEQNWPGSGDRHSFARSGNNGSSLASRGSYSVRGVVHSPKNPNTNGGSDTTPPTVNITSGQTSGGTYNSLQRVTWHIDDGTGSGIDHWGQGWDQDPGANPFSTSDGYLDLPVGTHTLHVHVRDKAGNEKDWTFGPYTYAPAPQVGQGSGGNIDQRYVDCYNRVGPGVVGNVSNYVHSATGSFGNGGAQDFSGGTGGQDIIMAKDGAAQAFNTRGDIWKAYSSLGYASSSLGFPTSDEQDADPSPQGTTGRVSHFESGVITSTPSGTYEVHGGIFVKYVAAGASGGALGFPTGDTIINPGSVGRYGTSGYMQLFEGGGIFSSHFGTYEIHGTIWSQYVLKIVGGIFGFPTSDEQSATPSPQGTTGSVVHFENGVVCNTAKYGVHGVYGAIFQKYAAAGGSGGVYGFPTSEWYDWNGGTRQDFEGGYLTTGVTIHTHLLWNNSDGRVMLWSITPDGAFTLNGFGPYTDGAPQNKWSATAVATGPDGKSHLLWNNTDGRVMLWTVDDAGSFTLAGYGSYTDGAPQNKWSATAVSVGPDNVVHLLWNNTDNRVMLWNVAQDFTFTLTGFGPYTDNAPQNKWRATALATGPDNVSRIVWNNTDYRVMLWKVDSAFNFTLAGYGPYTDGAPQNVWSAAGVSVGPDNLTHLLWSNTDRRAMFWNVNSAFGFTLAGFGPYTDNAPGNLWYAGAVATGPDGLNHVLWDNTDYRAMLWGVDNSFGFTVAGYGPYTDNAPGNLWSATAISAGP